MRKILFAIFSVCVLALTSCAEGDGDKDYGLMKIYMPQAMAGGGIGNIYNVPSGGGEYTYNFEADGDNINVFLGVMRSGKAAGEAFTVDIQTSEEQSAEQAAELGAEAMPASVYTLPSKVTVEAGTNSKTFHLVLAKQALSTYAGKKLVLCIGLANPSKYELSDKGTVVTVLVDVDALMKSI